MKKTVIETAKKSEKIKILNKFSTADDILAELEDISPLHSEDGTQKKKLTKAQKRKLIQQRIEERNEEIRTKALNKFFE